ncbi:LysR family transcriptional regulator [Prauserella halophila]|nr:LysR family transcriptional regulator [Prauserella halophila]
MATASVDLRRLEYFLAIVDHGGVGRAAEALLVAQPSLSQGIKVLERELGARLFDRTGRRLTLTEAGSALVGPARQMSRNVRAASRAARRVAELRGGWLTLIALPTLAVDPLVELTSRFRCRYPEVGLDVLAPDHPADVEERVRCGDCEFGLTLLPEGSDRRDEPDLTVHELGERRFEVVLPPTSVEPDAEGQEDSEDEVPVTRTSLTDLPWVLTPPGSATRDLVETAAGGEITVAVETDDRDAVLPLVLAGAGATILPAPAAEVAALRGARVRSTHPPLARKIGLVHRRGPLSAPAEAFLAVAVASPGGDSGI